MPINSPKHSSHHILAKSMGGSNNKHNLVELKHNFHQQLHWVFWTEIMPDKIKKLIWVEYTALKASVVARLLAVLDEIGEDREDWYRPECMKENEYK